MASNELPVVSKTLCVDQCHVLSQLRWFLCGGLSLICSQWSQSAFCSASYYFIVTSSHIYFLYFVICCSEYGYVIDSMDFFFLFEKSNLSYRPWLKDMMRQPSHVGPKAYSKVSNISKNKRIAVKQPQLLPSVLPHRYCFLTFCAQCLLEK